MQTSRLTGTPEGLLLLCKIPKNRPYIYYYLLLILILIYTTSLDLTKPLS